MKRASWPDVKSDGKRERSTEGGGTLVGGRDSVWDVVRGFAAMALVERWKGESVLMDVLVGAAEVSVGAEDSSKSSQTASSFAAADVLLALTAICGEGLLASLNGLGDGTLFDSGWGLASRPGSSNARRSKAGVIDWLAI